MQFENECDYVNASLNDFLKWHNSSHIDTNNPFRKYDKNEYWVYADYKYMVELIEKSFEKVNIIL